jgi:DNA polymerase-3 subunit epsilon
MLTGRTVVAHNATFDMRFLQCELQRAHYVIPDRPAALCSMKWAGRAIGAAKLEQCCEAFDIPLLDAHSALGDARATAQLMAYLMAMCCDTDAWRDDVKRCAAYAWPTPFGAITNVAAVLRGQGSAHPNEWLRTVLRASWVPGHPEDEAAYLLMLEKALLDRSISRTEGRQLVDAAEAAGLRRETIDRLHHDYLHNVAQEALADGVVTDAERGDLVSVATALGFDTREVDKALKWAATHAAARQAPEFALRPGDRVVFTGEMKRDRHDWVAAIVGAGLSSGGVTKSTRVVVAADPDSLSGKAAKARAYGVPLISEDAFERMFTQYQVADSTPAR